MLIPASRLLPVFMALIAALNSTGCADIGYYTQAVSGQLTILSHTHAIADLLDDRPVSGDDPYVSRQPVSPAVKTRLATVLRIREFASHALGLPENDSYRVYADLDRDHLAWNVVVTPEFSLTPVEWCFPIAGCVPYRGYFSQQHAERFAREMHERNLDVRVAAVTGYSTLGWFNDPVFSMQLRRSDTALAALIFHELAHQELYLPGDATFNESFATTVEIEGMQRWLAQNNEQSALDRYAQDQSRRTRFVELLLKYRNRLEALYAATLNASAMRSEKKRCYEDLRMEYAELRRLWGGYDGYDHWFAQELNNAHLASVGLYHQYVPAFQKLLKSVHGDLPGFYRLARRLSRLPAVERAALLEPDDVTQALAPARQ